VTGCRDAAGTSFRMFGPMSLFRIVYLEPVPPEVEQIIRSRLPAGFELRFRGPQESAESAVAEAEFVIVATTPLSAEAIAAGKRLRLIQHQGVGYEKTDVAAAESRGVPVAVCPAGTTIGVAEHVLLLILAVFKRLPLADASLRRGEWLQWELRPGSYELAGKRLGLVGFGRIGEAVAHRARAFEARVLVCEKSPERAKYARSLDIEPFALEDLLAEVDILSLHLPLTSETHHLIDAAALGRMQPTAILINTARGPLVDEAALVAALQAGRLAGAGLDVFEHEPLPGDHPLLQIPNVVVTPHISAGTRDALIAKMDACFANIARVARGERPLETVAA
jgi:phosphoglycerate dehydrogenase-like enzyme